MKAFFNEITLNGTNTNGFSLKFAKKICIRYGLKLGKYARVRRLLPIWYCNALDMDAPTKPMTASSMLKKRRSELRQSPSFRELDNAELNVVDRRFRSFGRLRSLKPNAVSQSMEYDLDIFDELKEEISGGNEVEMSLFDAMRQHLSEKEHFDAVVVLEEMFDDEGYDTDTLKRAATNDSSRLTQWKEPISRFLRGTECM